ncbi:hypothetical protein [Acrocarpospora catenulata]|uniref:hypothetical protein n=1 Tax=Acrocarpospora catenulata TaxID=2836182 RepID=UPI001BD9D2DC|nr:hypothetical protein [Acrocarpospora catenulata]
MRRWVALAAAALLAVSVTPGTATAQAAPPHPLQAIKKQLHSGHGVRLAELSWVTIKKERVTVLRSFSDLQLSPRGVVGYDLSVKLEPLEDEGPAYDALVSANMLDQVQITHAGGATYMIGDFDSRPLPTGKSWIRLTTPLPDMYTNQSVDLFNPRIRTALLRGKTGKAVSGGGRLYQGVVTSARLEKLRTGKTIKDKSKVLWRLWTDAKGLPLRLRSTYFLDLEFLKAEVSTETRFRDWGVPMVITPPPASQVVNESELPPFTFELPADLLKATS